MKSKHIRFIILLASIALTGVLINQGFWINKEIQVQKNQVEIQKKNIALEKIQFENVVTLALVNVRDQLISLNDGLKELYLEPVQQITPNYFVVSFYDTINPTILENLLVEEFEQYNVQEKFEFGIYDCFTDSMIFDRYVDLSSSNHLRGSVNKNSIFKWDHDGHYFGVFFSEKENNQIIESLEISNSLIVSTLVIFLVLIILSYSITIILQQKRLSEIKNDFINNMTHELKTPISTISLSSEVLLKENIHESPKRIKQYAKIIQSEKNRLELLVEKVLQLAQLNKGEFNLTKEEADINALIKKCISSYELIINKRKGKITSELEAKNYVVSFDKMHLSNVISNLIDNAIKYSPEQPQINISTKDKNKGIEVVITDKGKGMTKEQCLLIFEKFYRVPTGSIHDVKGFGIGLYYVKFILHEHNGYIHASSKKNEGTVMTFWIPKK